MPSTIKAKSAGMPMRLETRFSRIHKKINGCDEQVCIHGIPPLLNGDLRIIKLLQYLFVTNNVGIICEIYNKHINDMRVKRYFAPLII